VSAWSQNMSAPRAQPAADPPEQGLLVGQGHVDEGVEGHHGIQAGGPQVQGGHIGLDQGGGGDQAAGAGELDGGEIHPGHPQPVTGQRAGGPQADATAQVGDGGAGGQERCQLRNPAVIAADIFGEGAGRLAVVTAVGQRNRVVAAADERALPWRRALRLPSSGWHAMAQDGALLGTRRARATRHRAERCTSLGCCTFVLCWWAVGVSSLQAALKSCGLASACGAGCPPASPGLFVRRAAR
jgi:hypothetical protein